MHRLLMTVAALTLSTGVAHAATFDVNQVLGVGGVVGTIETDGTLGVLSTDNIVDWDLTLTDMSGSFVLDGFTNGDIRVSGSAFSATATELLFDFTQADGFAIIQNPVLGSRINFFCVANIVCGGAQGVTAGLGDGTQVSITPTSSAFVVGTLETNVAAVPLPASSLLLLAGLGGLAAVRRRTSAA